MDTRSIVIAYVRRLIDYGKDWPDPEFDELTLGQIADRIIAVIQKELQSE